MRRTSGTVALQTMNMCLFPVRPKIVCFAILLCRNNERRRCFSRSSGRHEATTTTRRLLLLLGILKFANHNGQSLNCSDNQGRAALVIVPLGFSVFGQIVTENNGIRAFNGGRQLSLLGRICQHYPKEVKWDVPANQIDSSNRFKAKSQFTPVKVFKSRSKLCYCQLHCSSYYTTRLSCQ